MVNTVAKAVIAALLTLGTFVPVCVAGDAAAVTFEIMTGRLETQARRLPPEMAAHAMRGAGYDLAWPRSAEEYRAIGNSAVVLVSVVTRDARELPLRRIYLEAKGQEAPLNTLRCHRSEVAEGSPIRAVFGQYREDCFFLVPGAALLREGALRADFSANRTAFSLIDLPVDTPPQVRSTIEKASGKSPPVDQKTLNAMIEREYPGYRPPPGSEARASAATDIQIAFSKRLGVDIFAEGDGSGWCRPELKLRVVAQEESFFRSPEFANLMWTAGTQAIAKKCAAAEKALITGFAKAPKEPVFSGEASRRDGWAIAAASARAPVRPTVPSAGPPSSGGGPAAELFSAAERGDLAAIDRLLAQGVDVNSKDARGETALMKAAEQGQSLAVHALLARKADVNARGNEGHTALMYAAFAGQVEAVQALLGGGAAIDAASRDGATAQTLAARNGHEATARVLRDAAARSSGKDAGSPKKDSGGSVIGSAEPMESGIPQPFRGTWGSAEGCDPANETDLLVVVDATSLTYYEAQCKLRTVAVTDAHRFSGRFDCIEYEHKWIQDVSMKLDNGKLTHEWAGSQPDSRFRCR